MVRVASATLSAVQSERAGPSSEAADDAAAGVEEISYKNTTL